MKKQIKSVCIYLAGFITATAFFFGANGAWASQILQAIYVDTNPIKILIDGQERNPSSDMLPFIYNGRTYVALRYVGEAFGKQVDWSSTTRTVSITDPKPQLTEYSESFTNATRISDYWVKTQGDTWMIDGPNGLRMNSGGQMSLVDFFPNAKVDFTVEYEITNIGSGIDLPYILLGIDANGNYVDQFSFAHPAWTPSEYEIRYNEAANPGLNVGVNIGRYYDVSFARGGEYIPIKIQVKDGHASIYMNNVNVAQRGLNANRAAFAFICGSSALTTPSCYIRNFKITID
ncbi:MAG: copper amine oxidase N-terminal domain-containing protein [Defluviitaleaceae bacterium]|nr:copper amine oxidase N-terminal domain-containing protein [Defluviitaleaceae bacterium]